MPDVRIMHSFPRLSTALPCLGNWATLFALLGLILLALAGCRKDGSDLPPPPGSGGGGVYTHVVGLVEAENGTPIAGASITCGGKTATTDAAGAFLIRDVNTDGRCYAHATKAGYFPGSAGVPAKANGTSRVRITLLSDEPVATFSAGSGTEHILSGGGRIAIEGNTVVDANGQAYTGTVSLAMRHLDPDAPEFPAIMPGGDLVATGPDGDRQLISYGMMMLRMTDGVGNELQLASGSTAEIAMPVPASMTAGAPQEMPLWHFNETTGKWEQEGMMQLQGGAYVATLGHFSSWNADLPTDRGKVRGRVLDVNGDPAEGVVVQTGQTEVVTGPEGWYERFLPTGLLVEVRVADPVLGLSSEILILDPLSDGDDITLADLHLNVNPAYVQYELTCSGGGVPLGYVTLSWGGGSVMSPFAAPGTYKLAVPSNGSSAQLSVVHGNGVPGGTTVTLPGTQGAITTAGSFNVCAQGGASYGGSYIIDGDGHNNEAVMIVTSGITAMASYYPDDDATVGYASQQADLWLSVAFPGNGTGTWNTADSDAMVALNLGSNTYSAKDLTLQVTEYGAVGATISGTFSGTFSRFDQTTMEEIPVTVTDGHFQLLRNPDEN